MSLSLTKIIFGMKVRQAREQKGMSLSDFSKACGLSLSYLTEIEKGKKYPRADKIINMAEVLDKEYDELVSIKLPNSLVHLESALSSSILQRFPFEEFGLEAQDLVNLLTRQPDKASALLHAILAIGRHYDLSEEDFLWAALRSYQEIYENYFPDLEAAASQFARDFGSYGLRTEPPLQVSALESILAQEYQYDIDYEKLAEKEELSGYRSVLLQGSRPRLLVNPALNPIQIKFVLARELGYLRLGLSERSLTSTPEQADSFEQILNDFKAAYFGGALLMGQHQITSDLQNFFKLSSFETRPLLEMLDRYEVTPEMLLYRFSEVIPEFFGIQLHFLRFHHSRQDDRAVYRIVKQLNMNQLLVPSGIGLAEHYCRRWLPVRLLREYRSREGDRDVPEVGAQISEFVESQDRFFSIGFVRSLVLRPDVDSCVAVGFRLDSDLNKTVRFLGDQNISFRLINETCERCALSEEQCEVRAAPPTLLEEQEKRKRRKVALDRLRGEA